MVMNQKIIKMGRVTFLGRPNTGKSTLLNTIMQQKVAITSPLPQTTRKTNQVVYSSDKGQLILTDTPGVFHKVEDQVSKKVNLEAPKSVLRADVVVVVVDISRPKNEEENKAIGLARKSSGKKVLVYNKIDVAKGKKNHIADYNYLEDEFDRVVSVSALKGTNVKDLINKIYELLPETTNQDIQKDIKALSSNKGPVISLPSTEFVAEIIREKAYLFLREELPYTINVVVNRIIDKKKLLVVEANILTTDPRYRKMIVGANGRKIKEIGYNARKELELMSGRKIFLDLEVVVDSHWPERIV
jgi:GTP-binding protein Era